METVRVRFGPRYMNRVEERAMFASWDGIYRRVREQNLAGGVASLAPANTTELHRRNVISALTKEHATAHSVT